MWHGSLTEHFHISLSPGCVDVVSEELDNGTCYFYAVVTLDLLTRLGLSSDDVESHYIPCNMKQPSQNHDVIDFLPNNDQLVRRCLMYCILPIKHPPPTRPLFFIAEMPKSRKPKSDLSLSWLLFPVTLF